MKNKLIANENHFSIEQMHMIYVINRVSEDAIKYLTSRQKKDFSMKFMIFDEMMKYLEIIFVNSNHLAKIKREFTALIMKQTDDFHQFFIKFQHMIEEIKIVEKNFKYELNSRLFYNIHIVVIEAYIKNKDFKKFVDVISQITDSHKEVYE